MRKFWAIVLISLLFAAPAQADILINGTLAPNDGTNPFAIVHGPIWFRNYSNATRPAANAFSAGTTIYNTDTNTLQKTNGSAWSDVGTGTLTSISTTAPLAGGPITTSGTLSLNYGFGLSLDLSNNLQVDQTANYVWTGTHAFDAENNTNTKTVRASFENLTAATNVVNMQAPPMLEFRGQMWNGSASIDSRMAFYEAPGATAASLFLLNNINAAGYSTSAANGVAFKFISDGRIVAGPSQNISVQGNAADAMMTVNDTTGQGIILQTVGNSNGLQIVNNALSIIPTTSSVALGTTASPWGDMHAATATVGDGTSGAKILHFSNASTGSLSWNPTGSRTITIPDTTDTLVVQARTLTAGTGLTGGGNLSADRSFAVSYGSSAGTSTQGNDTRLPPSPTTNGNLIYDTGSSYTALADVTVGSYLRSGGVAGAPVWSTLTLPNAATTGDLLYATGTNQVGNLADVAVNQVLLSGGVGALPTWGTVGNSALTNSSVTLNTTSPIGGGGTVALGGSLTFTCSSCITGTPTAVGDIMYSTSGGQGTSPLADVASGSYLRSGGVGSAPVWSTTTLPNSATTGDLLYASASNVYSNLADVAAGSFLRSGGTSTAPAWSTLVLPNAATTGDVLAATSANTVGRITAVTANSFFQSAGTSTLPAWVATPVFGAGATASGSTSFDLSGSSGTWKPPTGGLAATLAFNANIGVTTTSGTGAFDFSNGSGLFKTSTGAVTIGPGNVGISGAASFTGATNTFTNSIANSSGAWSINGIGGLNLQRNGSTLLDIGVTGSTTLTMAAGVTLSGAAGSGALTLGSMTGDSTLPTGNLTWTAASSKTAEFNGFVGVGPVTPTYGLQLLGSGERQQAIGDVGSLALSNQGSAGSTRVDYFVVCIDAAGNKTTGVYISTLTANATLNGSNFNRLTFTRPTGCVSTDGYRFNSGASGNGATTGSIWLAQTGLTQDDQGAAASAYTLPTRNKTADDNGDGFASLNNGGSAPTAALSMLGGGIGIVGLNEASSTSPTVTATGADNSKVNTYQIVAYDAAGNTAIATGAGSNSHGPTALSTTNYLTITWPAVSGAVYYDVYANARASTPTTTGLIGSKIIGTSYVDTGLTATAYNLPAGNNTGRFFSTINGLGSNQTSPGLDLQNTTAAGASAQQAAPNIHFLGSGWKTNSTAAAQNVEMWETMLPEQGAANPSASLAFSYSINGGAQTNLWQMEQNSTTGKISWITNGGTGIEVDGSSVLYLRGTSADKIEMTGNAFMPLSDNAYVLGDSTSANAWSFVGSYRFAGKRQIITNNGAITVTATSGETVILTANGNISSISINTGADGQIMSLMMVQNGGSATWPSTITNASLAGGTFTKTTTSGAIDTITFRYNSGTSKWIEIGRALNVS